MENILEDFYEVLNSTSQELALVESVSKGLGDLLSVVENLREKVDELLEVSITRHSSCEDISLALELEKSDDPLETVVFIIDSYKKSQSMSKLDKQRTLRLVLKIIINEMQKI